MAPTVTKDFGFLPIPAGLRYDPERPAKFGFILNASFGLGSTFVVSNLYYCQPLLIQLSKSFGVNYNQVSNIPTLIQAGYATGLLLISPLGDLVRRRPLILLLVLLTTALTIGLAVTPSLAVFEGLSFLVGVFSVVPQILIPLAADLAPPEKRGAAISLVLAGLLCGILYARVIGGVIAEFTSWRVVYYVSIGIQAVVLFGTYAILPDYPAKNPDLTYFTILFTMAKLAVTEPTLIQACLISIGSSACFSSFWVTLTFLLGGEPYNYNTLVIGLFGLVGFAGVALSPFTGRLVDRLVPWYATLIGIFGYMLSQAIQVGAGGINIAAVVIACIGLDLFRQMAQISLTSAVYGIDEKARARLNAVLIISIFIGQVMGTAVGTIVYTKYGWRACAALSLGWMGFELLILLLRGPHVGRYTWFGYEGGWSARKGAKTRDMGMVDSEKEKDNNTANSNLTQTDAEAGAPPVETARDLDMTAKQ